MFGTWERDTGVRETLSPVFQVTEAALAGRPVVLPRPGKRDYIYARDIAGGLLALLDRAEAPSGVVNLAPGVEWTVADWCDRLALRLPGFSYSFAGPDLAATVDHHAARDRSPLDNTRLLEEVGFRPSFGLSEAFEDYMTWLGVPAAATAAP